MTRSRHLRTSATTTVAVLIATLLTSALISTGDVAAAQTTHYSRGAGSTEGDAAAQPGAGAPTGPAPAPEPYDFDGTEVLVGVGESIQAAVDAHPAGTHFRLAAGVHRLQAVRPKDGTTFTGEPGAVLSGATPLDPAAFRRVGSTWVIGGQTAESFTVGETLPGHERHAAMNDLFLGDAVADHQATRADVDAPGEWFFDYDRDEVVLFDDPRSVGGVELSVVESAFRSAASDVTIQHLTVVRYAAPSQHGAIHAAEGVRWTIGYTTVDQAHGTGVRLGAGTHLHHSRILRSGQIGVGGTDISGDVQLPVLVEHNEIAGNRTLGYDWGWEGGATKFALTRDAVVQHNWVHGNHGPGIWFDVDNADAVIRSNLVEGNDQAGVFYEISFGAEIVDNVIRGNGVTAVGDEGAGVHVANSRDVEVHRNAIYGNRSAVMATQSDRGSSDLGAREVTGLHVHHNDLVPGEVPTGLRVYHGDPAHYYGAAGNRFDSNTYRMDGGTAAFWAGQHLDLRGWQDRGYDRSVIVHPAGTTPQLPQGGTGFQSAPVGPAA